EIASTTRHFTSWLRAATPPSNVSGRFLSGSGAAPQLTGRQVCALGHRGELEPRHAPVGVVEARRGAADGTVRPSDAVEGVEIPDRRFDGQHWQRETPIEVLQARLSVEPLQE